MNMKILSVLTIVILWAGLSLHARAEKLSALHSNLHLNLEAGVRLDQVVIGEDASIEFYGRTAETGESCLPAQIFVEGERWAWYPVYTCANVDASGGWFIRVPSDDGGHPVDVYFTIAK